jgi:copper oxidase (laccase) domain-containing protein
MGFLNQNIENIDVCTFDNEAQFFSNRRDGGVLGLSMSAIGFPR